MYNYEKLLSADGVPFKPISNENIIKRESTILTFITWISVRLLFVIQRLEIDKKYTKNSWHFTLKSIKD